MGISYTPLVTWDSLSSGDYIYTPGYLGTSSLYSGDYKYTLVTLELVPNKVGITYTPLVSWDSLYSGDYIYTPGYQGTTPM